MKIPAAIKGPAALYGGLIIGGVVLLYVLSKFGSKIGQAVGSGVATTAAGTAQGVIQGLDTNALTQGGPATGFGGNENYDYTGYGALSTPAALANKVSGGLFATIGETIGGWFAPSYDPNATTSQATTAQATQAATRDQVVTPNYVDDLSTLTGP